MYLDYYHCVHFIEIAIVPLRVCRFHEQYFQSLYRLTIYVTFIIIYVSLFKIPVVEDCDDDYDDDSKLKLRLNKERLELLLLTKAIIILHVDILLSTRIKLRIIRINRKVVSPFFFSAAT